MSEGGHWNEDAGPQFQGLFGRVALDAMQNALYDDELEAAWKERKRIFGRPEVMDVEKYILRAIAGPYVGEARSLGKGRRPEGARLPREAPSRPALIPFLFPDSGSPRMA